MTNHPNRYQINARIVADDTTGMNAADWFNGRILTQTYASEIEADRAARAAYRGPDVDGVEVAWDIERAV